MNHVKYIIIALLAYVQPTVAQISFNANTVSNTYNGHFLYGSNMGYRGPGWYDEDIADILAGNPQQNIPGIGVNSLRPALYGHFVEEWGYDIRVDAFRHYEDIGAKDNVVFLNEPSAKQTENKYYCAQQKSQNFANLYEPIWDNGENGTPVNDQNYYALYVYKVAKLYSRQVKFWEVWNEPDYTWSGHGDAGPGEEGNWWEHDPDPCDLANLYSPIQSYVRLLRITYEVVKSVDPEAFICVGGIGYPSFLDAVLRNTDNPDKGAVTPQYPEKGGAWFDCVSYHIYPMYFLREWSNDIGWFIYKRNTDHAVQTVIDRKDELHQVMTKHGYGTTWPAKEYIITECNIPRKPFPDGDGGSYIGSDEAQRNFLVKSLVACQRAGIKAFHVYGVYEGRPENEAGDPIDLMGLYKHLPEYKGQQVIPTKSGIAWRTTYNLLHERTYDPARSQELNLPAETDGGAFYSETDRDYIYVLWAKTSGDTERASYDYRFPASWRVDGVTYFLWDESSGSRTGDALQLTQSPVFIRTSSTSGIEEVQPQYGGFDVYPTQSSGQFSVKFTLAEPETVELNLYALTGSLVRRLLPRQLLPGGQSGFAFDVKLPSGAYILTLSKPSGVASRKIIIN